MKRRFFTFTLVFAIFTAISNTVIFTLPLSRKIIVIDAGHGGWIPGMVQGKTEEKHISLSISKKAAIIP